MIEYDLEPIRGLPGDLPEGERIVWQGSPDARTFARSALFSRWIAGYFTLLALWALASGNLGAIVATVLSGAAVLGLIHLFAALVAKTTVYTITNRRVVLRIGIALNKCINLPLRLIGSANLRAHGAGFGDIALLPSAAHGLGYAMLWPHVRPFRFGAPEPMLRALPDAGRVSELLAKACAGQSAIERGEPAHAATAVEPVGRKAAA